MAKKLTKKNFREVLNKIAEAFDANSPEEKKYWIDSLNEMLDEMKNNDFFGTEGQLDPRGDAR